MAEKKGAQRVVVRKPDGKKLLVRLGRKGKDNINMDL
jgi:hypothetical protein